MKKTIATLLTLTVIAVGGIVFAHNWIGNLGDDVTIKETVLAGDKKAAEGITVTTSSHYEETPLFWQTACTIGEDNQVETQADYDRDRYDAYSWNGEPAMSLGYTDDLSMSNVGIEEQPETYGYSMEMFADIIADTPAGGHHKGTIKLSDYISYRKVLIDASDYGAGKDLVMMSGTDDGSYFRFPMTEESEAIVRVEMSASGQITSLSVEPQYDYEADSKVAIADDRKYAYAAVGDMHLIEYDEEWEPCIVHSVPLEPGTCGVHCFPIDVKEDEAGRIDADIKIEKGRLVYPLIQGTGIEKLWLSADESQLLMLTLEDGVIWFTALDSKTFEAEQRLRLYTNDTSVCDDVIVRDGEDYISAFFDDGNVALLTKDEKGWQLEGVDQLYRGETVEYSFSGMLDDENLFDAAFDGRRFALINRITAQAGSYYLWVYEDGRCKYAGAYESSLFQCDGYEGTDDYPTDNAYVRYTYKDGYKVGFSNDEI